MAIKGIEGMTERDIFEAVARGGRFVHYPYCISIVLVTLRRQSDVFFVPAGQSSVVKGLPYALISLFFGWWGFRGGRFLPLQA
jgi:hypothetical protein